MKYNIDISLTINLLSKEEFEQRKYKHAGDNYTFEDDYTYEEYIKDVVNDTANNIDESQYCDELDWKDIQLMYVSVVSHRHW